MAQIDVQTEIETGSGWTFGVRLTDGGTSHDFDVTLSWADYDLWSRGQTAPERVVKAVFTFLLEREPAGAILERFDCATVRRYFPDADRVLPTML